MFVFKQVVRLFCLVLVFLNPESFAAEKNIILWHKETGARELLESLCADFSSRYSIQVRMEYIPHDQMKQHLLKAVARKQAPDAVLVPSDFVGLYQELALAAVPLTLQHPDIEAKYLASVEHAGTYYGAPIVGGNHLLLFYNKKFVRQAAQTWEELLKQKKDIEAQGVQVIGWNYQEMYWFVPFLGAFGGWPLEGHLDSPAMHQALVFYKSLADQGLIPHSCTYDCSLSRFVAEEFAYAINGDWAYAEIAQALGDKLGLALLPSIADKALVPMFSSHALLFPNHSLSGPKASELQQFILFMQQPENQGRWYSTTKRIPVLGKVLKDIRENADAQQQQILRQLDFAQPMPNDPVMAFVWEALRKGFLLFMTGSVDEKTASRYMQELTERQ